MKDTVNMEQIINSSIHKKQTQHKKNTHETTQITQKWQQPNGTTNEEPTTTAHRKVRNMS